MATPYLGQVSFFGFNFAPSGWALCNGQLLPINQNAALFSVLGTTFGGNGTTNFALPNLQGRVPVGSQGGTPVEGQVGGEDTHTLTLGELPGHTHLAFGVATGTVASPANALLGTPAGGGPYTAAPAAGAVGLAAGSLAGAGGGAAHDNHQPYTTVSACIALQGIFPSRN